MDTPAPATAPLRLPSVMTGASARRAIARCSGPISREAAAGLSSLAWKTDRSPPATKARPSAETTTTRTEGSPSARSTAASKPSATSTPIALRRWGRLKRISATPSPER